MRAAAASRVARSSSHPSREPPPPGEVAPRTLRGALRLGGGLSRSARPVTLHASALLVQAGVSRQRARFFSSTSTRSRCFAATRGATYTVSVLDLGSRPVQRRSSSASAGDSWGDVALASAHRLARLATASFRLHHPPPASAAPGRDRFSRRRTPGVQGGAARNPRRRS